VINLSNPPAHLDKWVQSEKTAGTKVTRRQNTRREGDDRYDLSASCIDSQRLTKPGSFAGAGEPGMVIAIETPAPIDEFGRTD